MAQTIVKMMDDLTLNIKFLNQYIIKDNWYLILGKLNANRLALMLLIVLMLLIILMLNEKKYFIFFFRLQYTGLII